MMRKYLTGLLAVAALSLAFAGMAVADTDPSVHQIYEAASSGRLNEAQQMMDQVLRDHPNSSKAHYVQSELYAREGKLDLARDELQRAELLSPGLPRENPRSVAELKSELGLARRVERPLSTSRQPTPHFPWTTLLILAVAVGVIWALFRRRTAYASYPPGGATPASTTYGPGAPAPGGTVGGGGIGSAVAGGLAGGLAAGAGIVAGEELAHHFLDGGRPTPPTPLTDNGEANAENSDMGGADFGVNDPASWDDGGGGLGGGGGGGDDWT